MTKKKETKTQPAKPKFSGDDKELRSEIKQRLPGTACRKIHAELNPNMTLDRFSFLFGEVAAECGEGEDGELV